MRNILFISALVALLGFGCVGPQTETENGDQTVEDNVYENTQYGFSFVYPSNIDARVREDEVRSSTYVGLDVDFFLSVRDVVREDKPLNLAYFYAAPGLSLDAFKAALEASDPAVKVKSSEEVVVNNMTLTKVVSSTAIEIDKTHYVFEGKEGNLVIISVFLEEDANFQPVFDTLRKL